ncbi:AI-2E family transporter [Polymorphobacter glacialis]|uniref:AI-2E family transporter n=1 Tax=Sandarakinorhabdus glacialis TaxID=1614636 RepID=A0A917EAN0_9SPHN|nr:AI-2E family transporter [Polymorphobacter glacialis]GGE15505.1 AI-2E family transporter [Polymorphobacter glacialis]
MSEAGQNPVETPSPIEPRSARARGTTETAFIWLGIASLFWIAWQLSHALLLIFAGLVFAAGLQAGASVLGKVWKASHGVRLSFVVLAFAALVLAFIAFAGLSLAEQAQELGTTLQNQFGRLATTAREYGIHVPKGDLIAAAKAQLGNQLGLITEYVGAAIGGLGSLLLIVTLGIYFAADPKLYESGVEWLTPQASREKVGATIDEMAHVLRRWLAGRLLTMVIEGSFIFVGLAIIGVPLAGLLGLVAGLLAFIPTLGAIISGALIILVGFSAGTTEGLWAVGLYLTVQLLEGNVLTPLIEKRAVDLAPAVVLAAQLLFGVLFGLIGVALADPIIALAKVALEKRSPKNAE